MNRHKKEIDKVKLERETGGQTHVTQFVLERERDKEKLKITKLITFLTGNQIYSVKIPNVLYGLNSIGLHR